MTYINKQVGILMDKIKKHNQIIAAAKTGWIKENSTGLQKYFYL